MSIDRESFEDENIESSLEQYGVWVKKSPAETPLEVSPHIDDEESNDNSEILDLGEEDFDTGSLEIFSDDSPAFEDDFDIDFDSGIDSQNNLVMDEEDADNTTLTTDELLNITNGMDAQEATSEEDIAFDDTFEVSEDNEFDINLGDDFEISTDDTFEVGSSDDFEISTDDTFEVGSSDDFEISTDDTFEVSSSDDFEIGTDDTFEVSSSDDFEISTDDSFEVSSSDDFEISTDDSFVVDSSDDFDMDFDSFMEESTVETNGDSEEPVNEEHAESETFSDFDLMNEDTITSVSEDEIEKTDSEEMASFDDFDISFDDFDSDTISEEDNSNETVVESSFEMEEPVQDDSIEFEETETISANEPESIEHSPIDSDDDIVFEESDDMSFSISDETSFESEFEDSSVDFGEEISLEDNTPIDDSKEDFVEEQVETVQSSAAPDTSDVLNQIVAELSNLRNEMSQFKTELAKIKTDKTNAPTKQDAEEGGFFADYEGDDTIALSGDELNNILTSADFTVDDEPTDEMDSFGDIENEDFNTESAEDNSFNVSDDDLTETNNESIDTVEDSFESETVIEDSNDIEENADEEISLDISDEAFEINDLENDYFANNENTLVLEDKELVEPSLDDLTFDMDGDDGLPDEIDVPVIEDLVVDSSPVNFFDDEEEEPKEIDDSAMQYLQDVPTNEEVVSSDESIIEVTDETVIEEPTSEIVEESIEIDESSIIDEEEDYDDTQVDEEISSEIKDSEVIETYTEPDSNSPVSSVFKSDQWQSGLSTDDEEEFVEMDRGIAPNMQEEIKSVLSYMDRLLESLPEEKISEFAQSEYFGRYKKLFSDLGIS